MTLPFHRLLALLPIILGCGISSADGPRVTTSTAAASPSPNWHAEVTHAGGVRYEIVLRMRAVAAGGDGEAAMTFRHVAHGLVLAQGQRGYDVKAYSEYIESGLPFPNRVARGVVELR